MNGITISIINANIVKTSKNDASLACVSNCLYKVPLAFLVAENVG